MFKDKKYLSIIYTLIITFAFFILSTFGRNYLDGAGWFLFSSFLRLFFGIIIIFIMEKIFDKKLCDIIHFKNWKQALIAGSGFLFYFFYYLILLLAGYKSIVGLTVGLFISQIILQQITTGFYEELCFRALLLESYFYQERHIKFDKILYSSISFLLFGLIHVIPDWDLHTFLYTGIIGFAFAVVYLKSHNILMLMIMHFIYDVFANLSTYMEWNDSQIFYSLNSFFDAVLGIMFVISVFQLVKKE